MPRIFDSLITKIIKSLNVTLKNLNTDKEIKDIKDLFSSTENDITFFHSKKYKNIANKTKASFCITTDTLKKELPEGCKPLVVDNVLVSTSKVTSLFYPDAINDDFDKTVKDISDTEFNTKVKIGLRVQPKNSTWKRFGVPNNNVINVNYGLYPKIFYNMSND